MKWTTTQTFAVPLLWQVTVPVSFNDILSDIAGNLNQEKPGEFHIDEKGPLNVDVVNRKIAVCWRAHTPSFPHRSTLDIMATLQETAERLKELSIIQFNKF